MNYRVTAYGKASHSSMPEAGINAINQLTAFIAQADASMDEITARYDNPKLGHVTHAITIFSGGNQINSIPEKAVVEGNIRTIPEFNNDAVKALLASIIEAINGQFDARLEIEWTPPGRKT